MSPFKDAMGWSVVCDCGISWSYSLVNVSWHSVANQRLVRFSFIHKVVDISTEIKILGYISLWPVDMLDDMSFLSIIELDLYFMIIYLCMKYESNTPMFSKDIARKPFFVRTGRTYVRTYVRTYGQG